MILGQPRPGCGRARSRRSGRRIGRELEQTARLFFILSDRPHWRLGPQEIDELCLDPEGAMMLAVTRSWLNQKVVERWEHA
jgi:hypothetical protein